MQQLQQTAAETIRHKTLSAGGERDVLVRADDLEAVMGVADTWSGSMCELYGYTAEIEKRL